MKSNVGAADRAIRVVAGVVILGLGLHFGTWWGLIGLAPLLTGILAYCPAYSPLGISTSKACSDSEKGSCCCCK